MKRLSPVTALILALPAFLFAADSGPKTAKVEYLLTHSVSLFAELNNVAGETYWIYADLSGKAAGLYEMPERNAHFGVRVSL